ATDYRGKNLSMTNNKVPNLKSVFVRHALGMQIPYEQGILNSVRKNPARTELMELEPIVGVTEEYRVFVTAEVLYELPESKLKLKKRVPILNNLTQDIFTYKKEMDTVISELKLSGKEQLEFLKAHIHEDIRVKVKEAETYEKYFEKIFRRKYKSKFSEKYENLLLRTKQSNHVTIKEYKDQLDNITKRISITDKLSKVEGKQLIKKWFFKGLHMETKLMLAKEGIKSMKKAIQIIQSVELILSNAGQGKKFNQVIHKSFKNMKINDSLENTSQNFKNEKKIFNEKKILIEKKINSIQQSLPRLRIQYQETGEVIQALYDTGATDSFINKELAERWDLKINETREKGLNVILTDGSDVAIEGETEIIICIDEKEIPVKLLVMKMKEPIIIGYDLITTHKITINHETNEFNILGKVVVNGQNVVIKKRSDLYIKTLNIKEKIKERIDKYKGKVDIKKPIKDACFGIDLTTDKIP
ncbi:hypothetical protein M153_9550003744, partial [Pseudoloma neurophilia]